MLLVFNMPKDFILLEEVIICLPIQLFKRLSAVCPNTSRNPPSGNSVLGVSVYPSSGSSFKMHVPEEGGTSCS